MGEKGRGAGSSRACRDAEGAPVERVATSPTPFDLAAQALLDRYGLRGCTLEPLCYSENHTYRVTRQKDGRHVATARICRPGYRNVGELQAEVSWLLRLHHAVHLEGAELIRPLQAADGTYVQSIQLPDDGQALHAVAFAYMEGSQPGDDDPVALRRLFRRLGALAAALHAHATPEAAGVSLRQPLRLPGTPVLMRPTWDCTTALGSRATWGDWRSFPGLTSHDARILAQAEARIKHAMAAYGKPRDRFGLIHADMRLANLLVEGAGPHGTLKLLDFDDCAYSWYLFDLAASLSFIEARPDLSDLISCWLGGYRAAGASSTARPLAPADVAVIPSLVMMRRLQLTGWLSTRHDSDPASLVSPTWRDDTVSMALRYLGGNLIAAEE